MRKHVAVVCALFFAAFIAGCGGDGGSAFSPIVKPGATTEKIPAAEVSGKTLYSTSIDGITAYTLNNDAGQTASWNSTPAKTDPVTPDVSGTWQISEDGSLVLTGSAGVTIQFKRIQKENSGATGEYWLVFDQSNIIGRFFLDLQTARVYDAAKLGGSVQGTPPPLSRTVSTLAGAAGIAAFTNNSSGKSATTARFNHPVGITTDGTNLYLADHNNNAIRMIDRQSDVVTTLAVTDEASGFPVFFNHPADITTDGTNLYVTDFGNNSIRIINIATKRATTIGSASGEAGSVDADVPADVRFSSPIGITTDGTNLYVADSGNNTIRKIVISSKAVTTLAGTAGTAGSADGVQAAARFNLPARLTTDGSNLYVSDFNNRTIRRIVIATGNVTTIAGSAGIAGSADSAASGATARFTQPNGITADGKNLYVTDSYNNTIRKIVLSPATVFSGPVTTIAGIAGQAGHADTAAGTPSFDTPIGITTDGTSLFVADSLNHTIRKID